MRRSSPSQKRDRRGSLFGDLVVNPEVETRNIIEDNITRLQKELLLPDLENPQAVHNNLGNAYTNSGNLIKAIEHFNLALQLDNDDPAVNMNMGIAHKHLDRFEEAITYFKKSLILRPTADEHYNLGNTLMKLGPSKNGEAIFQFKEALKLNPKHKLVHMNLGTAFKQGGLLDEAISSMKYAIELYDEDADEDSSFNAHYNLANALYTRKVGNDLSDAVEQYELALDIDDDDVDARINLGITYHDLGNFAEAIENYTTVSVQQPGDFGVHFNLANSLFDNGQLDDAIEQFGEARVLDPDHEDTQYNLGVVLLEAERYEELIDLYTEFLSNTPDIEKSDATIHYNLGVAYSKIDKPLEAASTFKRAIQIDPDRAVFHMNLGNVLESLGQGEEAVVEYRAAIELDPTNVNIIRNLAFTLIEHKRLEEGVEELRNVLKVHPDDEEMLSYMEQVQDELKQISELKAEIARCTQKVEAEPTVMNLADLGMSLRNNEEYQAAIIQFEKCLELQPGHPQITEILNDVREQYEVEERERERTLTSAKSDLDKLAIENSENSNVTASTMQQVDSSIFNDDIESDEEVTPKMKGRSFSMLGGKKKGRVMHGNGSKKKVVKSNASSGKIHP